MTEIAKRYAEDAAFREVANILYGDGYAPIVKMNPDVGDVAVGLAERKKKKSEQTQARIGLASNLVGLGAGAAATKGAIKDFQTAKKTPQPIKLVGGKLQRGGPKGSGLRALKGMAGSNKAKIAAGAGLGLQVGNLAGDAIANRVLSRAAKKDKVKKDAREIPETAEGKFKAGKGNVKGKLKMIAKPDKTETTRVRKSAELDVVWEGEISKMNTDRRQVFGWASIVEMDGEKVVDLQGDYISIEEVEKSAYDYVHKSRKGGDMHLRDQLDGEDRVVHKSDMIESMVVTPDKKKALGLPDSAPTGWWVGYQINDDELWGKVKSGERTGFSIHGRGVRSDYVG